MSDDGSKRRPRDTRRIYMGDERDVDYWCERFGCTETQLKDAVLKVGTSAEEVKRELKVGGKQA